MKAMLTLLSVAAITVSVLEFADGAQVIIGKGENVEADLADFHKKNADSQGYWEVQEKFSMDSEVKCEEIRMVDVEYHDNFIKAVDPIEVIGAALTGISLEEYLEPRKVTLRDYGSVTIH